MSCRKIMYQDKYKAEGNIAFPSALYYTVIERGLPS